MTAKQLFQAGKLNDAVKALAAEVRDNPTDPRRRTFLFELLCFAGEFDRAEKHLHVLAQNNSNSEMGAVLYFSALHAERTRLEKFAQGDMSSGQSDKQSSGTLNGQPFTSIVDADPRIGPRLELFAAGAYMWIPFEHIDSIEIQAPTKLRDLLWVPALVRTGPSFKDTELGEVLIPVQYPKSFANENDNVRLGRETHWQEVAGGEPIPVGQKVFLVDGEEFPLLEVRKIEFTAQESAAA
ncbi:MAG TPA: type VI secretion system accessory protein TagJ [Bryobacteraceae bacterium]|nr:type VI secretion system accessory protein TagJ [Bryobacteraceae bacterium]